MTVFKTTSGRWRAQYNRKTIGTFRTKAEARGAEADYIAERKGDRSGVTISEWITEWTALQTHVAPATRVLYLHKMSTFVKKHGETRLVDFTKLDATKWAAHNRSSVRELKRAFGTAFELDMTPGNVWASLKSPVHKRQIEPGWLTGEDIAELLEITRRMIPDEFGRLCARKIETGAWTGLRPGELRAVLPGDRGEESDAAGVRRATLHVHASIRTKTGERGPVKGTLEKPGKPRTIILPPAAEEAMAEGIELAAWLWGTDAHRSEVFRNIRGDTWRSSAWTYHWKFIRDAFGRPKMELYELRHFAATRLLEAGLSVEDVATQLGHRDGGKLVIDTYGHPDEIHARERISAAMTRLAEGDARARARKDEGPAASPQPALA